MSVVVPGHRDAQQGERVPARVLAEIGTLHRTESTSTAVDVWWFEDLETGVVTEVRYGPGGAQRVTYEHQEEGE